MSTLSISVLLIIVMLVVLAYVTFLIKIEDNSIKISILWITKKIPLNEIESIEILPRSHVISFRVFGAGVPYVFSCGYCTGKLGWVSAYTKGYNPNVLLVRLKTKKKVVLGYKSINDLVKRLIDKNITLIR